MEDKAVQWAIPIINELAKGNPANVDTWSKFKAELQTSFGNADMVTAAIQQMKDLTDITHPDCQTRDTAAFCAEFQVLAEKVQFGD